MQCAQCGFMLAPLQTTCPRCQHVSGTPVAPYVPPQTVIPPQINVTTPPPTLPVGRAVSAGFFGVIGVWLASLGVGCVLPALTCGIVAVIGVILVILASISH